MRFSELFTRRSLGVFSIGCLVGVFVYLLLIRPAFSQEKKLTVTDTLVPVPEIVLVPRVITGNHSSVAADDMTIPKGSHVKVAIVVFALPDAKVEATRHCTSAVTKAKKSGTTTVSSESVSTDTKAVGKTGVLLSWRQLDPAGAGVCTLTVKLGTTEKSFTVKGAE